MAASVHMSVTCTGARSHGVSTHECHVYRHAGSTVVFPFEPPLGCGRGRWRMELWLISKSPSVKVTCTPDRPAVGRGGECKDPRDLRADPV